MLRPLFYFGTAALTTASLSAATVTTTAVQDAHVAASSSADSNFDDPEQLLVKAGGSLSSITRKAYMRFDLSGLAAPTLTPEAKLQLDVRSMFGNGGNSHGFRVYGINDTAAGQNWDETTITWNNAPGNWTISQAALLESESTLLGTFSVADGTTDADLEFSSDELDSFLLADSDGLITLAITRTTFNSSANSSFYSRENADTDGPQLSYNAVPEPGSLALIAFGGFIAARRRRM